MPERVVCGQSLDCQSYVLTETDALMGEKSKTTQIPAVTKNRNTSEGIWGDITFSTLTSVSGDCSYVS